MSSENRYGDLYIFIPEMKQIIRIAEGIGDNLLSEDIEEGYVDYIYYEQHELSQDFPEIDGGQVLLEDRYYGCCQCPGCGRWYSIAGDEVNPPDEWEEDLEEDEW